MRNLRQYSRRRGPRPVRVVNDDKQRLPLDADEINAYAVGIAAARDLQTHFAAFYSTYVAPLPISLEHLTGCCLAFLQLVEADLPLRWPDEEWWVLPTGDTPETTLQAAPYVTPELVLELGYYLAGPRPCYYGLGVETIADTITDAVSVLSVTLWHLFRETPWGLGFGIAPGSRVVAGLDRAVVQRIVRLVPLAASIVPDLVGARFDLAEATAEGVSAGHVLAYAFARTHNDLANTTDYEVEVIHDDEYDEEWGWDDLPRLITLAREAQAIARAYAAWSARISDDPIRGIVLLARDIRRAAHRAAHVPQEHPGAPLICLLTSSVWVSGTCMVGEEAPQ